MTAPTVRSKPVATIKHHIRSLQCCEGVSVGIHNPVVLLGGYMHICVRRGTRCSNNIYEVRYIMCEQSEVRCENLHSRSELVNGSVDEQLHSCMEKGM